VIESDVQKLNPGAIVEMFVLDPTALGGSIIRWYSGVNVLGNNLVWDGNVYTRFAVQASGFERSSKGTHPKPKIKIANIGGVISALVRDYEDLAGAIVTRKRTFVRYLDAVNFPGGVNPEEDPTASYPDEVWSVDRKSGENGIFVEFELAAAYDVRGKKLPGRQCIQNVCTWLYRGSECGFSGGAVSTKNDVPTTDIALDQCGKRLASCKQRFGEYAPLPFGAFPGVGLIR